MSPSSPTSAAARPTALMTASYAPDFERCALLCESLDRHVQGDWHHYLLVDTPDVQRFRSLEGPRRSVVDQRELLPWWLRAVPDPTRPRRKLWLRPFGKPLRGWHVQQIMKIAFAAIAREPGVIAIDSDVILMRDFDPATLWHGDDYRLYRLPDEIHADIRSDHVAWLAHSDRLLGIGPYRLPAAGFIDSMVSWRTDTVRAMIAYIEKRHGVSWQRAVTQDRAFAEYIIYGRFVGEVLGDAGHWPTAEPFCQVAWFKDSFEKGIDGLRRLVGEMGPNQIGIGVQSFIGYDMNDIRRVVEEIRVAS
ncbi:hypothetical protein BJF93_05870 [Xaviernesmea oryzae]|uniref:Uncharacterized protein n=1 Tax=Xaviernesmea oryzae TaxID=464029 RepID=A0A1Q9ART5_9HYPH|nr:DUF6492 family protein [Xaviernesmea oryzae]OLP58152.1 hypothetical protein BJF93_05870 [Xaviernesmea oryzae]SEL80879.1 hypothetical protein SAMN04487976_11328 [Xaviernesmea oryzae]